MRVTKNYWFVASALLVVTGAILFSAKRVEAQYASPVKVLKTTSAPAIGSLMDDPGRIPYNSMQSTNPSGTISVTLTYPVVPANHRLVVTQIVGNLQLTNNDALAIAAYYDAGQAPRVNIFDYSNPGLSGSEVVTLNGYMLDCAAAPCEAIAH